MKPFGTAKKKSMDELLRRQLVLDLHFHFHIFCLFFFVVSIGKHPVPASRELVSDDSCVVDMSVCVCDT